jgi:hypothetical protein
MIRAAHPLSLTALAVLIPFAGVVPAENVIRRIDDETGMRQVEL